MSNIVRVSVRWWPVVVAVLIVTALFLGVVLVRPARSQSTVVTPRRGRVLAKPLRPTEPPRPTEHEVGGSERLPDLDQEAPGELSIQLDEVGGRPSYRLGFRSAVRNVGAGPLVLVGSRSS